MTNTLINLYQIEFSNVATKNSVTGIVTISKFPKILNEALFDLLFSWRNPQFIDEDLLLCFNSAISDNNMVETGSERYSILIFQTHVDFYDDNGLLYSFPTLDIKEIVIGWRDFLLTAPLHGTIV